MLEYSTYSVISPEGCASILWKSADNAEDAAEALGITSKRLKELGLIDRIIEEPLGGAHRDIDAMAASVKQVLLEELRHLQTVPPQELMEARYRHLMAYGEFTDRQS
jgi:acetyl-CoA carboxylase carboxyl transferase subunit alpha